MNRNPEQRRDLIRRAAAALLAMQRHSWEQGLAMQAFYECGDMDMVVRLCVESINRITADGRPASIGVSDGCVDPCSVGEPLLAAIRYLKQLDRSRQPDKARHSEGKSRIDHGANDIIDLLEFGAGQLSEWALKTAQRNPDGIVYHLTGGTEFWADSVYMLPPYLAAAGHIDLAIRHIDAYWNALYDPHSGLICHIWDDEKKVMRDPDHWGVGNGWVLMGIIRVIGMLNDRINQGKTEGKTESETEDRTEESEMLPSYTDAREKLQKYVIVLLDRILPLRDDHGDFHNILDDPDSFPETGIASMIAWCIYKGISQGWLPKKYYSIAEDLRLYAENKIDCFGFIRDVCGAPTFDKAGIAPEQQAIFMMMENASITLMDSWHLKPSTLEIFG